MRVWIYKENVTNMPTDEAKKMKYFIVTIYIKNFHHTCFWFGGVFGGVLGYILGYFKSI